MVCCCSALGDCLAAQAPFTIAKTGPQAPLTPGQQFNYIVTVVFLSPAKGVRIVDNLPSAVNVTSVPATWRPDGTNATTGGHHTIQ